MNNADKGVSLEECEGLLLVNAPCPFCSWPKGSVHQVLDGAVWVECCDCFAQGPVAETQEEAVSTMLDVHHKGAGICGVFTRDVAETKAELVATLARRNEDPLQCRVEKE